MVLLIIPLKSERLCADETSDSSRPVLRVLTYNIHHGEGTDGKFDYDRLVKTIRQLNPDVIALQEVDKSTRRAKGVDQAAMLAKRLKMHHVFGNALHYSGGQYGEAILSRFPIQSAKTHALPYRFGNEPRIALAAHIIPDNGLPKFELVATLLCHQEEVTRLDQVKRLNSLFYSSGSTPVILTGDFNALPESAPMQLLLKQNWKDAVAPQSRIDYILLRKSDPWVLIKTTVVDEPIVSDHDPVLSVLTWAPR